MFTKEQLQGILLSLAKTEITVQRQESRDVGFAVRLAVHFRAKNLEFVEALQRTFLIPVIPDALGQWDNFLQALEIVEYGEHLNQDGIQEIIDLKEENK